MADGRGSMNFLLHPGDLVRVSFPMINPSKLTGIIIEIHGVSVMVLWADGNISHVPEYTLERVA